MRLKGLTVPAITCSSAICNGDDHHYLSDMNPKTVLMFFLVMQEKEGSQVDLPIPHARFQRTDQWRPVYSWLESLEKDEVVKSKDISDWLNENPKVQEQLCSRHSRYHLMHYIKKCHMKILKRREKKKVLHTYHLSF